MAARANKLAMGANGLTTVANNLTTVANNLTNAANGIAEAANTLALAGIRPCMLVQTSHGELFIKVVLKNDGGGPAIINSVTYELPGRQVITDTKPVHDAHPENFYGLLNYRDPNVVPRRGALPALLDDQLEPAHNDIGYNIAGQALGTGKELVLLACKVHTAAAGRAFLNSIRALLNGAVITVDYQDARDQGPEQRQLKHPLAITYRS